MLKTGWKEPPVKDILSLKDEDQDTAIIIDIPMGLSNRSTRLELVN